METKDSSILYILAASKPFYKDIFEYPQGAPTDQWCWVENREELYEALARCKSIRYIFFLHWNWYVEQSVWEKYECVCFHMTDVPYGRGGSPLQNLILRGHTETKVSALRMVDEMDAGPVYVKRSVSLEGTAEEIYRRVGRCSLEIIDWMIKDNPKPCPQVGKPVCFDRRKPGQSEMPKDIGLDQLYDFIRMLDAPTYPHAFIVHGDYILEFDSATRMDEHVEARVRFKKANRELK